MRYSRTVFKSVSLRRPRVLAAAFAAVAALGFGLASPAAPSAQAQSSLIDGTFQLPGNQSKQPWLGNQPKIVNKRHVNGNFWKVDVWSPANRAVITNNVLLPGGNQPRGSFYLLPGIQGGEQGMNWMSHTDIGPWFAGKNVNVVMPIGGAYSLYTDWNTADPILGVNKWNTYMTHELPPLIDAEFHGTGRDAIAGLSSTGAAALDIAGHAPQRFRAAASYSGCPVRSGALGWPVSSVMMAAGGGSSVNAWGLPGSPAWADHDPNAQPHRLRDVKVFVASASGAPGPIDGNYGPAQHLGPSATERVANECTNIYTRSARAAGVDVNRYYTNTGSHSFPLFSHQLKVSWAQTIQPTIGG